MPLAFFWHEVNNANDYNLQPINIHEEKFGFCDTYWNWIILLNFCIKLWGNSDR